jgi:hypothetical protein
MMAAAHFFPPLLPLGQLRLFAALSRHSSCCLDAARTRLSAGSIAFCRAFACFVGLLAAALAVAFLRPVLYLDVVKVLRLPTSTQRKRAREGQSRESSSITKSSFET